MIEICLIWSVPNQLKHTRMMEWMMGGHVQGNDPFVWLGRINAALSSCCDVIISICVSPGKPWPLHAQVLR